MPGDAKSGIALLAAMLEGLRSELARHLEAHQAQLDDLEERFGALFELIKALAGVEPSAAAEEGASPEGLAEPGEGQGGP